MKKVLLEAGIIIAPAATIYGLLVGLQLATQSGSAALSEHPCAALFALGLPVTLRLIVETFGKGLE